jgi:hypothetical protein
MVGTEGGTDDEEEVILGADRVDGVAGKGLLFIRMVGSRNFEAV